MQFSNIDEPNLETLEPKPEIWNVLLDLRFSWQRIGNEDGRIVGQTGY